MGLDNLTAETITVAQSLELAERIVNTDFHPLLSSSVSRYNWWGQIDDSKLKIIFNGSPVNGILGNGLFQVGITNPNRVYFGAQTPDLGDEFEVDLKKHEKDALLSEAISWSIYVIPPFIAYHGLLTASQTQAPVA